MKNKIKNHEEIEALKKDNVWYAKDVANFIGKSENTIRWMVHVGKLPCKKIGGKLIFSELAIRSMYLVS